MESRRPRKAELAAQAEEIQRLTERVEALEAWSETLKGMFVLFDELVAKLEPGVPSEEEE